MSPELLIGILSRELPLDGLAQRVSSGLPSIDFALQKPRSWNSAIQALAAEDSDLNLGHVEPTRVLRCVVEVHSAQQGAGRTFAQYVVEALSEVDVQVVQHEVHLARGRVRVGQKRLDEDNEVGLATLGGNRDDALSRPWLDGHEQIGGAFANVLVVLLGPCARRHGQRLAAVSKELQALLVNADDGFIATQRLGVERQQVVHAAPVLFGQRADAPHQPPPG